MSHWKGLLENPSPALQTPPINRLTLLSDGDAAFRTVWQAIDKAKGHEAQQNHDALNRCSGGPVQETTGRYSLATRKLDFQVDLVNRSNTYGVLSAVKNMKTNGQSQERSFTNKQELRVVGMSRSGNHAIINWILSQIPGRYVFLNCADPKSNPFRTARPMSTGRPFCTNLENFDLEREQHGHFASKDCLLHSYEDCFLGMVCSEAFEEQHDAYVGASQQRLDVLILRDPFNLFASRKKSGFYEDRERIGRHSFVTKKTAARIWKQHARVFAGERSYLTQPTVTISYNRWTHETAYRRQVAEQLGLQFSDAGFQRIPRTGGGSSFDGFAFDHEAEKMKVLQRWQHFEDDFAFQEIFDDEMKRLSAKIFGSMPAAEKQL